jgi:hypothetical protein
MEVYLFWQQLYMRHWWYIPWTRNPRYVWGFSDGLSNPYSIFSSFWVSFPFANQPALKATFEHADGTSF